MEEKYIKCPDCGGSGVKECGLNGYYLACETCHGEGILEEKTMDLENVTVIDEINEAMNEKADPTNPNHYKSSTSLECIEEMEIIFGINAVICFCVCNAWKYIRRWKNKNGAEDLKKAKWYIDRAQTLIYDNDNFVVAARKRYAEILLRMDDYIDKVERKLKDED